MARQMRLVGPVGGVATTRNTPRILALLSVALWLCASSITPAQTAPSSTAQAGSVVSNAPSASAASSQTATNPSAPRRGHFVPDDQSQQATTNAQTNSVVDARKREALWNLPFDELKKRAEAGDADAQCQLGIVYGIGHGTSQDYAEAVKWYRKAADQGRIHPQARPSAWRFGQKRLCPDPPAPTFNLLSSRKLDASACASRCYFPRARTYQVAGFHRNQPVSHRNQFAFTR